MVVVVVVWKTYPVGSVGSDVWSVECLGGRRRQSSLGNVIAVAKPCTPHNHARFSANHALPILDHKHPLMSR